MTAGRWRRRGIQLTPPVLAGGGGEAAKVEGARGLGAERSQVVKSGYSLKT